MTYEDIAAFLADSAGSAPPTGTTIQQWLSDAGTVIASGWVAVKSGANGIVNNVRTIATGGVSSGVALITMDVGAAGAAIAPLLGVAAGATLYSAAPDFWNKVADKLVAAGQTIGGKCYAFLQANGKTVFSTDTISAFRDAFIELNIYQDPANAWDGTLPQSFPALKKPLAYGINMLEFGTAPNVEKLYFAASGMVIETGHKCSIGYTFRDAIPASLVLSCIYSSGKTLRSIILASKHGFSDVNIRGVDMVTGQGVITGTSQIKQFTYDSKTVYYVSNLVEWSHFMIDIAGLFDNVNTDTDGSTEKYVAWLMVYGGAAIGDQPYTDTDATKPTDYPDTDSFMDALGEQPVSIPGVENPGYILNPTGVGTQTGALNPDIDWDKLWDWLMNPGLDITGNPALDTDLDGTTSGFDDVWNPTKTDAIEGDPPIPPDPVFPVPAIVTPTIPTSQSSGKLFEVYSVSDANLNTLGGYLWSTDILTQLQKIWSNPLEAVIGLFRVWASPSTGSTKQVYLGATPITGLSCPVVSNQFKRINLGSVNLAELNKNVGDYSPYTQVSLYLPFIGIVELDTDEVMAGSLNVQYVVDFWTGTCIAELRFTKSGSTNNALLYVYNGNMAQQIPLTSVSFNGMFSALLAAGSAIGTVASGGALAPAMIMGAGAVMTRDMVHVHRAGLISSNAGIMTDKKPCLIINRRNVYNATKYNELTGYPANKTKTLGNCSGLTRVKAINLQVSATDEEKEEIEQLLKEGVIL